MFTARESLNYITDLAVQQARTGNPGQARALANSAIDACADSARAHALFSRLADADRDHKVAIALARRALACAPDSAECHLQLGITLMRDAQYNEAIDCLQYARDRLPDNIAALHALAIWYHLNWQWEESVPLLEECVRRDPEHAGFALDLSLAVLQSGDWRRGLELHEARWRMLSKTLAWELRCPPWGGQDVGTDSLVIHGEQGLGDTVCYLRFLDRILERARPRGRVFLAVRRELVHLLRAQDWPAEVADIDSPADMVRLAAHVGGRGYHLPIMSAMRVLGVSGPGDIPGAPYLRAPQVHHTFPENALRVGVVWATSRVHEDGYRRVPPLRDLCELVAIPGVRLYSLQYGGTEELRAARADHAMVDLSASIRDYADLASVMVGLDVVVTPDTGPLHLAGALGVPVVLMQQFSACWRWNATWYRDLTEFQQSEPDRWDDVLERVTRHLRRLAADVRHRAGTPQEPPAVPSAAADLGVPEDVSE